MRNIPLTIAGNYHVPINSICNMLYKNQARSECGHYYVGSYVMRKRQQIKLTEKQKITKMKRSRNKANTKTKRERRKTIERKNIRRLFG